MRINYWDDFMIRNEMILFTKDRLHNVLGSLNIETKKNDDLEIILDAQTKKTAVCEVCEIKINTDNLGHIAHGSKKFYCKNPACFSHFIAKRKLW